MESITNDSETCFVICPIGDENTQTRKDSDKVLEEIIIPVIQEFNFTPLRADKISSPGMITSQIIDLLIDVPLVIADLTGSNANVFYELAVRHVIQKPCIMMIKKGQNIPFYVIPTRIVIFDYTNSQEIEEAKRLLKQQIMSIYNGQYSNLNPIAQANNNDIVYKMLLNRGDSKNDLLTVIFGSIADLNSTVNAMRRELYNLNATFSYLDNLGIPGMFKEQGIDLNEYQDMKISNLTLKLNELLELYKNNNDPHLKKQIDEIKRQIGMENYQKLLVKQEKEYIKARQK
jgi:hypothetical protein